MGGWEGVQVDDGWGLVQKDRGKGRGRVYEVIWNAKASVVNVNSERVC